MELEVSRITITRFLNQEGKDVIEVDCSDDLTLLDTLGLLTFAQASIVADADLGEMDEEDDF